MKVAFIIVLFVSFYGCTKNTSEEISKLDGSLNTIAESFSTKHDFVENKEVAKFLAGKGIKSRELSYKSGGCEYVITFSAKSKLELGGTMNTSDNKALVNCFTTNKEIINRFFIPLTTFHPAFSQDGLINLISNAVEISDSNGEKAKVLNVDGVEVALDHSKGTTTWMTSLPLPDYLK